MDVSGLLLHKDDVFVHVSHREGYEGPMSVEEEGFLAGSPMVCPFSCELSRWCCVVATVAGGRSGGCLGSRAIMHRHTCSLPNRFSTAASAHVTGTLI